MFCFRYRKLMVPYSEDSLDGRARAKLERHLAGCASCRAELACVNSVSDILRRSEVPAAQPSPELWSGVRRKIQAEPTPAPHRFALPRTAYALAGVLLVAFAGWGVFRVQPDIRRPAVRTVQKAHGGRETTVPVDGHAAIAQKAPQSAGSRPAAPIKPQSPPPRDAAPRTPEPTVVAKAPDSPAAYPEIADGSPGERSSAPAPAFRSGGSSADDAAALKSGSEPSVQADAGRDREVCDLVLIGNSQMAQGQKAEAARSYNRAYLSSDASLWPQITESVEKAGALEATAAQAEADFKSSRDKNLGLVLYTLQARQNNTAGMVTTARRLVRQHPDDPILWLRLGEAHEADGNISAAVQAYRKAASLPDKEISAKAEEKLRKLESASPHRGRD